MEVLVPRVRQVRGELRLAALRLAAAGLGVLLCTGGLLERTSGISEAFAGSVSVVAVIFVYSLLVFVLLRRGSYFRILPFVVSVLDTLAIALLLVLNVADPGATGSGLFPYFGLYFILIFTTILRHDETNTIVISLLAVTAYGLFNLLVHRAMADAEIIGFCLLALAGASATYVARSYSRFLAESIAAERKFLESDLRLKGIAASIPGILFQIRIQITGHVRFTYVSESASTLLGVEPGKIMENPGAIRSVMSQTTYRDLLARMQNAEIMSRPWTVDGELLTPTSVSGPRIPRWFRLLMKPSTLSTGERLLDGIALDIHEAKQVEQALVHARNAAVRASETKSEFLANVSHEFRTPLNGIIGTADLLAESSLDPEQRDALDTIRRSSETLLNILNDILDLARVETGNLAIEHRPFSISGVIYQTTHLLVSECSDRGIDLITEVPATIQDTVDGDPGRLGQVLFNLIGNAIKFTHHGHVRVSVSQRRTQIGQIETRIRVEDTGIGIQPDAMDTIFEKFQQGDRTAARRYGGTGLGLAISRQIVSLMGGSITARSTPEKGSVFSVEVPFTVSPVEARGQSATSVRLENSENRRAVLLDNHTARRISLARVLRSAGYHVKICAGVSADAQALDLADTIIVSCSFLSKCNDGDLELLRGRASRVPCFVAIDPGEQSRTSTLYPWARGLVRFPIRTAEMLQVLESGMAESVQQSGTEVEPRGLNAEGSHEIGKPDMLVADDNEVNRTITVRMLGRLGFDGLSAVDGKDAVEKAEATRFQLIILDFLMPRMNGVEAARAIRSGGANRTTPILLLTGQGVTDIDAQEYENAGITRWMTKPVRLNELSQVTAELLGRRSR